MKIVKIIVDEIPKDCYNCIIYTNQQKTPRCCAIKKLNYLLSRGDRATSLVPGKMCLLDTEDNYSFEKN